MAQLEQYRIFASVAQNKSFCKAAAELYITQPAISQSIKQLENELETQLFIRTSRGAQLTEAGETLFKYVEEALSILKNAEVHINELKALEHGQLNIGASDTLCHHYLLPYLQSFHQKYPHVNLKVTNRTSKETVELLRSGKVDIGFINMPTDIGENLEFKTLEVLHDCFVFNEKFFSVSSLSDILSLPILMLEKDSSTRRYTDSYFKTIGVNLNPQIELGSHELLLSFAKIGLGVAAVVREYSAEYIKSGILKEVNLKNSIPPRSIALVFHSKIPLSLSAKEFVKFFK